MIEELTIELRRIAEVSILLIPELWAQIERHFLKLEAVKVMILSTHLYNLRGQMNFILIFYASPLAQSQKPGGVEKYDDCEKTLRQIVSRGYGQASLGLPQASREALAPRRPGGKPSKTGEVLSSLTRPRAGALLFTRPFGESSRAGCSSALAHCLITLNELKHSLRANSPEVL